MLGASVDKLKRHIKEHPLLEFSIFCEQLLNNFHIKILLSPRR